MKILISNDDGIGAPGILVLEEIAKSISDDVYIVAPIANMSGAGHSLTLKTPLRLKAYDDHHFSVDGTPTDCIVMAMNHILTSPPDIVLTGINYDSNLAEDISYSGTVAAAMEARLLGIPSIAFSQMTFMDGTITWDIAKAHAADIVRKAMNQYVFPQDVILNVNFPAVRSPQEVSGFRITRQGLRVVDTHVIKSLDPRGKPYFWIGAAEYRKTSFEGGLDTDLGAINGGYISITPITFDFTAKETNGYLQEIFT
jgi:5'-nucleotidase